MFKLDSLRDRREAFIRASLIEELTESIQSLMQGPDYQTVPRLSASIPRGPVLGHTDNTNALCNILEAIFIHGLKNSLSERFVSVLLSDPDRMPVPNFWPVITVISHKDLIKQVSSFSCINTDVGRARSWLRLSLNQSQLISYIAVLASDKDTLKEYYRSSAILHDIECCDILLRVLQPMSGINLKLATNAAVLNVWTKTPLVLSGTWLPSKESDAMKSGAILAGTDIASTCGMNSPENFQVPIPNTPLSDRMFDLIIGNTPETDFIDHLQKNSNNVLTEADKTEESEGKGSKQEGKSDKRDRKSKKKDRKNDNHYKDEEIPGKIGESEVKDVKRDSGDTIIKDNFEESSQTESESALLLKITSVDKADEGINENSAEPVLADIQIQSSQESSVRERERHCSTTTSYSDAGSLFNRSISVCDNAEYQSLFSGWEVSESISDLPEFLTEKHNIPIPRDEHNTSIVSQEDQIDFEVLSMSLPINEAMDSREVEKYLPLLTTITSEEGVDHQQFKCRGETCSAHIGFVHGVPRLCKYDGKHYCSDCHSNFTSIIPARVVHNWDFTAYPVCNECKRWLDHAILRPLVNLRDINPKLYRHVDELAEIQNLRIQLHYIQAYLVTCRRDKGNTVRKILWPREYLFEHIHQYSIRDLHHVEQGRLLPIITECVVEGRLHISKCEVCSLRGFVCEKCKKDEIIFPFQLGETFTCGQCCSVYHSACIHDQFECLKCKRIKKRKEREKSEEVWDDLAS